MQYARTDRLFTEHDRGEFRRALSRVGQINQKRSRVRIAELCAMMQPKDGVVGLNPQSWLDLINAIDNGKGTQTFRAWQLAVLWGVLRTEMMDAEGKIKKMEGIHA